MRVIVSEGWIPDSSGMTGGEGGERVLVGLLAGFQFGEVSAIEASIPS